MKCYVSVQVTYLLDNHFTFKEMIKNGKKNKIRDLYSPFRCKEMSETAVRPYGQTAVSDISSHRNGEYRFFILFFFTILHHLLDCKMVSDRF